MSETTAIHKKHTNLSPSLLLNFVLAFIVIFGLLYMKAKNVNRKECIDVIKRGNFPNANGDVYIKTVVGNTTIVDYLKCKDFAYLNEIEKLQK